ncbi:MAG: metallophosphoesterase family protein [Balneolaceae bacterium]
MSYSESPSYIAIGDIHGCAKTLKLLLTQLSTEFGTSVEYVFLGDYVDRGPESNNVIEQCIEFSETHNCTFIRGNHDLVMLKALGKGGSKTDMLYWLGMGGSETMASYQSGVPKAHIEFLESTVTFYDTEEFFFVHASAPISVSLKKGKQIRDAESAYLWGRDHIGKENLPWEKTVVFGHTPFKAPLITNQMIGLDTGCVYVDRGYGLLTAMALPGMEIIQKECIDFN